MADVDAVSVNVSNVSVGNNNKRYGMRNRNGGGINVAATAYDDYGGSGGGNSGV